LLGLGRRRLRPAVDLVARSVLALTRLVGIGRREERRGEAHRVVLGPGDLLEEGVVLLAPELDRLAGEGFEGRPATPLRGGRDVLRRPGPGRDELADDDVLLETDQLVL